MSSQANVVEYGFLTSDSNLDPFASTPGTDKQYTVVKLNGDQVTPVTAIADVAFGILNNHPGVDEAAKVIVRGVAKVIAGGACTAGAPVYLLADGTVADSSAAGARLIGTCLRTGVALDIVEVDLTKLDISAPVQP